MRLALHRVGRCVWPARQDRQRVYMVLEYADGGDALKHIQSTGAISEHRARLWTSQIAAAVRYMHQLDVAHRDLKLENLLIDSTGDNVKLCDFGFVRDATSGDLSRTYCGSKSYAAPEILQARILSSHHITLRRQMQASTASVSEK